MNWHQVRLDDIAASPWRNGGGVTRELAAWPSAQDWLWRMSVAEVARSGPFSRFEGVQRWFVVLAGAGVRLAVGGPHAQTHELTYTSDPVCFDGAVPVHCQLRQGATEDFNLMVRRDKMAQMRRVTRELSVVLDSPKTIAIYSIDTWARVLFDHKSLVIAARSLAWQSLPAGAAVQVEAANALWMEIDP